VAENSEKIQMANHKLVSVHPSKNTKSSWSQPTTLSENSKTKQVFVPFYIDHSEHRALACKIETRKKQTGTGIEEWILDDAKSVSLNEVATKALAEALSISLKGAESGASKYIAIPVAGSVAGLTPAAISRTFREVVQNPQLLDQLLDGDDGTSLMSALRHATHVKQLTNAVEELKYNLSNGIVLEKDYQTWCDKYPWAFGLSYREPDVQKSVSIGDRLDLSLPSHLTGHRDIIELKRPNMQVLGYDKGHKNYYFSGDATKAIGQCVRYMDVLHEEAGNGLRDNRDFVAFHPRAVIVIGRSNEWDTDQRKALRALNSRLSGITVMTFDELLAQAQRLLDVIRPAEGESAAAFEHEDPDEDADF
jgi:hypothetical protein